MKQQLELDPALAALLGEIARLLPGMGVIVIGGAVLSGYPFFQRETDDLDLCVLVADERIQAVLSSSGEWQATTFPIRWVHIATGMCVDIIAAPPGDESPLVLSTDHELSRVGMGRLEEAAHSVPGLAATVRFAPVAAIVLLKIVAWLDRPSERQKDLADIRLILEHYENEIEIEDESLRTDRLIDAWQTRADLDFSLAEMGAWLLGKDMAQLASPGARQAVRTFVERNCEAPEDAINPDDPFVVLLPCLLRGFEEG